VIPVGVKLEDDPADRDGVGPREDEFGFGIGRVGDPGIDGLGREQGSGAGVRHKDTV